MTAAELEAFVRLLADDTVTPYQVASADITELVKEAALEATTRSFLLPLSSPDYDISLLAGTAVYAVAADVLRIRLAQVFGEAQPLVKTTREMLQDSFVDFSAQQGMPSAFFTEKSELTVFPEPIASGTLLLRGFRSSEDFTEIAPRYHRDLAYWVLYRIYSLRDADVENGQLAAEALQKFTKAFGTKRTAQFEESVRSSAAAALPSFNPF